MHMLITLLNNPMYLKLYTNTLAYTIHTHTPKQMYILNTDICISYHEFTSACLCVLLLFIFVSISVYPHFVYAILPLPPHFAKHPLHTVLYKKKMLKKEQIERKCN